MVTIGLRVEPEEREQLEDLAHQQGYSLCAFLRELVRRELAQYCPRKASVCPCSLSHYH